MLLGPCMPAHTQLCLCWWRTCEWGRRLRSRLVAIEDPELKKAGFARFGWVHPDECFGGELFDGERFGGERLTKRDIDYSNGTFVYTRKVG